MAFVDQPVVIINWIPMHHWINAVFAMATMTLVWILSAISTRIKLKKSNSIAKLHTTITSPLCQKVQRILKFCNRAILTILTTLVCRMNLSSYFVYGIHKIYLILYFKTFFSFVRRSRRIHFEWLQCDHTISEIVSIRWRYI